MRLEAKLKLIIRYLFWRGKPPKEIFLYASLSPCPYDYKASLPNRRGAGFCGLRPQKLSPPRAHIMELCVSKATIVAASVIDMRPRKRDLIV